MKNRWLNSPHWLVNKISRGSTEKKGHFLPHGRTLFGSSDLKSVFRACLLCERNCAIRRYWKACACNYKSKYFYRLTLTHFLIIILYIRFQRKMQQLLSVLFSLSRLISLSEGISRFCRQKPIQCTCWGFLKGRETWSRFMKDCHVAKSSTKLQI